MTAFVKYRPEPRVHSWNRQLNILYRHRCGADVLYCEAVDDYRSLLHCSKVVGGFWEDNTRWVGRLSRKIKTQQSEYDKNANHFD